MKENSFLRRVHDSLVPEGLSYLDDKKRAGNGELSLADRQEAEQRATLTLEKMEPEKREEVLIFEHMVDLHMIRHNRI